MTADKARELAAKHLDEVLDISAWVEYLDRRIFSEANLGKHSIDGIFSGVRMSINNEQKRLVREHYVSKGFTLTENVISWKRP